MAEAEPRERIAKQLGAPPSGSPVLEDIDLASDGVVIDSSGTPHQSFRSNPPGPLRAARPLRPSKPLLCSLLKPRVSRKRRQLVRFLQHAAGFLRRGEESPACPASAGSDGAVRLGDAETGRERTAFNWGVGQVYAVAFAPEAMKAAAGGEADIVVWDLDDASG
jgi:hypothetical protein